MKVFHGYGILSEHQQSTSREGLGNVYRLFLPVTQFPCSNSLNTSPLCFKSSLSTMNNTFLKAQKLNQEEYKLIFGLNTRKFWKLPKEDTQLQKFLIFFLHFCNIQNSGTFSLSWWLIGVYSFLCSRYMNRKTKIMAWHEAWRCKNRIQCWLCEDEPMFFKNCECQTIAIKITMFCILLL